MNPSLFVLSLLASGLLLGLLVVRVRTRRPAWTRRLLVVSPRYRSFFRARGLSRVEDFLNLPGQTPHIVSGHPDRHVVRISFEDGSERWTAFLKREHRVGRRTRLGNALAGCGFVSRSLREARMLQALQREGLPGPEWLAAGEDDEGRAFLLVRETPGAELRSVLQSERQPARRRRLARNLGALLGRLHACGFHHPDLYANHLLVDPQTGAIHLLDWQRARLRRSLSWRQRRRDLAALHATLADSLATPRERLLCLLAYGRAAGHAGIAWGRAVRQIESEARRLLGHRHIREKRQLPSAAQAWICLDGEALCVTPALQHSGQIPDYLRSPARETIAAATLVRRWPVGPEGGRMLLLRRRHLRRRDAVSPEQREAALLLRLQRHGIPAPRVLAMGHRRDGGRTESLLLTEPLSDTCSLEAWLACQTRRRATPAALDRRHSVLHQTGALLQRLHEASCYLDIGSAGCGLAVRQADGQIAVVLDRLDSLTPRRRPQPRRASRDVRRMRALLRAAGCPMLGTNHFNDGYNRSFAPRVRRVNEGRSRSSRRPAEARESLWARLLHGIRRVRQRPDWAEFAGADWTERIMDVAVTDHLNIKQGRSTGRWILHAPAEAARNARRLSVYLKRHYVLPWWKGLLASLWPGRGWSPAFLEWQQLDWARRQGLPVPQTVAAAEYIGPWGRLRSFLAVEELAGMLSLQEAIPLAAVRQEDAAFRRWKRSLAAEMARLARLLHDRRCFHKDLYLCHFFIERDDTRAAPAQGWRGRVHLIDLHRLAHHPWSWRLWQTKDIAQLLYSSEIIGVNARDRLAFWRDYRAEGPGRSRSAWVRWLIRYRWRRYRQHNARGRHGRENG